MSYMVGIVTKDRYNGLDVLLHSLRYISIPILLIDASDNYRDSKIITDKYHNIIVYRNNIQNYKAVVHNKNIIIHNFLKNKFDNLFIIEDDIKVLDCDVFEKYIKITEKYNIPHMNYCGYPQKQDIVYQINNDIQISEKLQGVFCFYTKKCLQHVGLMNPLLDNNCWEHIEHTYRIHRLYNYFPIFYHFPDIIDSWEYIKMQKLPSLISNSCKRNKIIQIDKIKMLKMLNIPSLPDVSIKQFDTKKLKIL